MTQRKSLLLRFASLSRSTKILVVATTVLVLAPIIFILILAVSSGIWFFSAFIPINPYNPECDWDRISFPSRLSQPFIESTAESLEYSDAPYFSVGSFLFTTRLGRHTENLDKAIPRISREGSKYQEMYPTERWGRIRALHVAWEKKDDWVRRSPEWCHLVEAVATVDGIAPKLRIENPEIWPPDKWQE